MKKVSNIYNVEHENLLKCLQKLLTIIFIKRQCQQKSEHTHRRRHTLFCWFGPDETTQTILEFGRAYLAEGTLIFVVKSSRKERVWTLLEYTRYMAAPGCAFNFSIWKKMAVWGISAPVHRQAGRKTHEKNIPVCEPLWRRSKIGYNLSTLVYV
jgi:hypothetical protein